MHRVERFGDLPRHEIQMGAVLIALEMLRDRSLSVKEVGYELGFKTSSHFVAVFRREFGTTPQGYRMREVLPQQN
jgi:AraC-like DNA-binding protein